MKLAGGLALAVVLSGGAWSQTITRSFGSVVFPGGTSATSPNITRSFGSVVFPGGSPSSPVVRSGPAVIPPSVLSGRPSSGFTGGNGFNRGGRPAGRNSRSVPATVYAYPVYVPGYFDAYGTADTVAPMVQPQQQPNVTVVYPQQQPQEVRPIIIQLGSDGQYTQAPRQPAVQSYQPEEPPAPAEPDEPHYLIAFKDHTIYSAVAYWFDGDTLHYFTRGDTHNQASVSLIDRGLTERLNRELNIDFKMPPVK